jgi:hypothetical protein
MKRFSSFPILVTLILAFLVGFSSASGAANASIPKTISSSTTEVNFIGKSEAMLDAACGSIPWPFRSASRNKFLKGLSDLNQPIINEAHVYQVVLKLTPSKFHPQTIEIFEKFN